MKLDLDALPFMETGTILHWDFSHFVVFERLRKGGVDIADPASGRRFVKMDQFRKSFTELVLKPGTDFRRAADERQPVWSYIRNLVQHSGLVWRIVVISGPRAALLAGSAGADGPAREQRGSA